MFYLELGNSMSLVSVLFKMPSKSQELPAPLTKLQRLQREIDQCDKDPIRAYNNNLTSTMAKVTELNSSHKAELALYRAGLVECLQEALSR
jgi:hypothetical protein